MNKKENRCFHCGLPCDNNPIIAKINKKPEKFCCIGCSSVANVIYQNGLNHFYDKLQQNLAPPPPKTSEYEVFDLENLQNEHITKNKNNSKIKLLIEGLHCAACVWLIEKTLAKYPGICVARVNLQDKSLNLTFNLAKIKLSTVASIIGSIGYRVHFYNTSTYNKQIANENKTKLYRIIFAGFAMMNLLWISISLYSGANKGEFAPWFRYLGFILATPTLFYSGFGFLRSAFLSLKAKHLGMDVPIAIGAVVTWGYSTYVTFFAPAIDAVYFDTVVNFIFVILIGRFLESSAREHALLSTQRMLNLQPTTAILYKNKKEKITPVVSLKKNDIVIVKSGDKIPIDGVIIEGVADINEASITGESNPVTKTKQDDVYAGTINTNGLLKIKTQKILKNSILGNIIHITEELSHSKPPIQKISDKIIPYFVSITLLLSVITFLLWISVDAQKALLASVSVLIITCPCALGLATPMAIAVASNLSAKFGILIKNSISLERLATIRHFIFDKTGTLTTGILQIENFYIEKGTTTDNFFSIAYMLEKNSSHPVAQAICQMRDKIKISYKHSCNNIKTHAGLGISATMGNKKLFIGTYEFLKKQKVQFSDACKKFVKNKKHKIYSQVLLAKENKCLGVIILSDKLKNKSSKLLEQLANDGVKTSILTGDKKEVTQNLMKDTNNNINIYANLLPMEKEKQVRLLQKKQDVVMVGDGINDAAALKRADVGIAMGSGADISLQSADIILLHNKLENITLAKNLSKQTIKTIKQNIVISFVYNVIMVPLAVAGLITPLIAAISMPISSLLVIINAGLIKFKIKNFTKL
jgi:P-type Cu2+ transporter